MRLPSATPTDVRTDGLTERVLTYREIPTLVNAHEKRERILIMAAMEVTCPVCGAASGAACTNPLTGETYRHYAPHLERIRATDALRRSEGGE